MDREAWNRCYADRELVWTSEPNRFLVAEAAGLEAGRALDVACGEGRNTVWLAECGWRVSGVDFSEVGLEKARALARARGVQAEWVVADLLAYTPEPRAFDLVLVFYLQVPAAERRPIVRAAAGAVAAGGAFLLVGHDSRNLELGHGGPQDPAVLYTAGDVLRDVEGTGLEIERAETVRRPVQTPEGNASRLTRSSAPAVPGRWSCPRSIAGDPPMSASLPDSNPREQMRDVLATPQPGTARSPQRVAAPQTGGMVADALLDPWFSYLQDRPGPTRLYDCHTHLGCADPDGSCFDVDELLGALAPVDGRAVVFPLAEPDGYRAANDQMLAAAAASKGRPVAFCRVDPHDGDAVREVERAVARGAAGIKLHPRAERFELGDPAVRRILALADERRLPVIVHAGRGIPALGRDALELARAYPRAPLILAHAAIADLAWIWREAAGRPNLFFGPAWWNTAISSRCSH